MILVRNEAKGYCKDECWSPQNEIVKIEAEELECRKREVEIVIRYTRADCQAVYDHQRV